MIVKAESGRPIRVQTIEDIADALSSDDAKVSPEDLVARPLKLAKSFVVRWFQPASSVWESIRPLTSPKVRFFFAGDPKLIPFAGTHCGWKNVARALAAHRSVMVPPDQSYDCRTAYDYMVNNQNPCEVVAWGESGFKPIDAPAPPRLKNQFRLVFQNGKLIEFEERFDTSLLARQLSRDPNLRS